MPRNRGTSGCLSAIVIQCWMYLQLFFISLAHVTFGLRRTADDMSVGDSSANDMEWFAGVAEEELLHYMGLGSGDSDSLWSVIGSFVPPPPRPPYLPEGMVDTDGLTTCDLCTWARGGLDRRSPFSLDATLEAPGQLGWVLTLVIVSLVSAGIGAVVMVTLLHCRRLKSAGGGSGAGGAAGTRRGASSGVAGRRRNRAARARAGGNCCGLGVDDPGSRGSGSPSIVGPGDGGMVSVIPDRPPLELDKLPPYHDVVSSLGHNVWSWLGSRRNESVVGTPLSLPRHRRGAAHHHPPTVENHYTHMQPDEALYAELDSQTASYASDLQLQICRRPGLVAYNPPQNGGNCAPDISKNLHHNHHHHRHSHHEDNDYHELDAARLHRHFGESYGDGSLPRKGIARTRHSQRLQGADYEMYSNEPESPGSPSRQQQSPQQSRSSSPQQTEQQPMQQPTSSREEQQPSYQNTAYTGSDVEQDCPTLSSAPSSAYYSDLSSNSASNQQHQQAVSTTSTNHLATLNPQNLVLPQYRLAAINESTVPSDYI